MSAFETAMDVRFVNGRLWMIIEMLVFHLGGATSPNVVEVPVGFMTDFASIPRLLWWLWPPAGPWAKAAALHDWLYKTRLVFHLLDHGADMVQKAPYACTRREADGTLYDAMIVSGVAKRDALCIYLGVRLCGWWPWLRYRRQDRKAGAR